MVRGYATLFSLKTFASLCAIATLYALNLGPLALHILASAGTMAAGVVGAVSPHVAKGVVSLIMSLPGAAWMVGTALHSHTTACVRYILGTPLIMKVAQIAAVSTVSRLTGAGELGAKLGRTIALKVRGGTILASISAGVVATAIAAGTGAGFGVEASLVCGALAAGVAGTTTFKATEAMRKRYERFARMEQAFTEHFVGLWMQTAGSVVTSYGIAAGVKVGASIAISTPESLVEYLGMASQTGEAGGAAGLAFVLFGRFHERVFRYELCPYLVESLLAKSSCVLRSATALSHSSIDTASL